MKPTIKSEECERTWLSVVQQQVDSLAFGVVQIVVHDGRVVQIERTEKVRLHKPEPKAGSEALQPTSPLAAS
jgi:hypothetical protein